MSDVCKVKYIISITGCACVVLCAAAVVIALRNRGCELPLLSPEPPAAPAEVRVRAVEAKAGAGKPVDAAAASAAVAIVCGADAGTAGRYEARSDALRSISRRTDLPNGDVAALMAYLRAQDGALRAERVAALKNDVMNLLHLQEPTPDGLAELLVGMFEGGEHPPAVLDYCIQHLGAMQDELEGAMRRRVRELFVRAAGDARRPYAGTALYSLAEDRRATREQEAELRRLTTSLCAAAEANGAARIAAIQLAGQRGYSEALPALREVLTGPQRDAVLDVVCIGSVGLLGDAGDLPALERFAGDRRRAEAVSAATRRIKERADGE